MKKIKQTYNDWDQIVKRLEDDVKKARETSIGVAIAIECQNYNLEYCKKRRDSFPKPKIIMESEEKKPEEEKEETEEEQSKE